MRKTTSFILILILTLLIPGQVCAQKQKARNTATTAIKTYPARDDAFLPDYKMPLAGPFSWQDPDVEYTLLEAPDFDGHLLKRNIQRKQVTLRQVSCSKNGITDVDDWFERLGAENRIYSYDEWPMQVMAPRFYIDAGDYCVLLYGTTWGHCFHMIIANKWLTEYYKAYDMDNYKLSPKTMNTSDTQTVEDVLIEGNIMYIAYGNRTYSKASGYQTGYITAIDLRTDEIIWTTQPLTCGSKIAITGNSIICGYGMTNEPDYVYVVDKYSGQRVQTITVKKAPEYVVIQGRKAYVRTYSFDYVFSF